MVLIAAAPVLPAMVRASGSNRVGLVVQYGNGSVTTRCVEFDESGITGYQVLKKAGLNPIVEFSGMGAAVCKIKSDGCDYPSEACFCQCQGNLCKYWVYHHLINGSWQYSNFGASNYTVKDGDVEGWAWGEGSPTGGLEPPIYTFDQICESVAPTNTDIPPTATPIPPTATWTVAAPPATPTSEPPALTETPTPQLLSEIEFWADTSTIAAGACTTLHWQTNNVQAVYLDGEGVQGTGSRQVCPIQTTEYTLQIKTASGDKKRSLTINVASGQTPTAPSTGTPVSTVATTMIPTVLLPAGLTAAVEAPAETVIPSPTLLPVGAISLPTHPPEFSPTPAGGLAMVVISAPTITRAPAAVQPGPAGSPSPDDSTAAAPDLDDDQTPVAAGSSPVGYVVFSMISMGLGTWLVTALLRKR